MSCCPPGAAGYLAADHNDEGSVKDAEGVPYYNSGSGETGLLLLGDIWGWNGGRIRAIGDDFAKKGFNVFVPKILKALEGGTDDDGLPPAFPLGERGSELGPLFKGDWNVEPVMPLILKVVAAMRASGVKKFGLIGFCYGGWVGMHLSKQVPGDELVCCASPHPSMHIEGMLGGSPAALAAEVQCPWALYPCGDAEKGGDPLIYDADGDLYKALEAKFPGKNETKRFAKQMHGFVTRGAIKDGNFKAGDGDDVKLAVEECVGDMLKFFAANGLGSKL
eukprot:TRINITY_DN9949_c1_g1_i1.p1 TRINITY_DN9949_c1_g1~~TRINITY_DN9949_c1_g1_i1.p1  ORF type:complete len:277 (+),score=85.57 TRINITY_DN9949_c1_g1_i1:77-907(+)